jgi:uncharacterized protein YycO
MMTQDKQNLFNSLKAGDILLVYNKRNIISFLITKITNTPWSHAALYVGNGEVVESTFSGVGKNCISKYYGDQFKLAGFTVIEATEEQRQGVVSQAEKRIGRRSGFFQILYLYFMYAFNLVGNSFWQREVDAGDICSEMIARGYQDAGLKLCNKSPSMVIPNDFAHCDKIKQI